MAKIVNPNQPFSPAQMAQLMEAFMDVNVIPASVKFPLAAEGGIAETAFASAMGYPEDMTHWYPTGLATGAAAIMAVLHGRFGSRFPEILVFGQPPDFPFLGTVELDAVRHEARETRYQWVSWDFIPNSGRINVLNFSHPISDAQKVEIETLFGYEDLGGEFGKLHDAVRFVEGLSRQYKYQTAEDLVAAVREQVDAAELSPDDWQLRKVVVNLPAHSGGAMIALAEMHGRMGYFPTVLRIERAEDGFHFTEAIDLEQLRLRALKSGQADQVLVSRKDLEALLSQVAISGGELIATESFRNLAKAIGFEF